MMRSAAHIPEVRKPSEDVSQCVRCVNHMKRFMQQRLLCLALIPSLCLGLLASTYCEATFTTCFVFVTLLATLLRVFKIGALQPDLVMSLSRARHARRRLLPCRLAGKRRLRAARGHRVRVVVSPVHLFVACVAPLCHALRSSTNEIASACHWHLSREARNRLVHATNGNGAKASGKGPRKGQSKGRSNAQGRGSEQPPAAMREGWVEDVPSQVATVMPLAAQLRAQPALVQREWSAPVILCSLLAVVRLARRCGHCAKSQTAYYGHFNYGTTGPARPERIPTISHLCYLQHHGRQRRAGQHSSPTVVNWLGFGSQVSQELPGLMVMLQQSMQEMVVKFASDHGWPCGEPIPAHWLAWSTR